MTARIGRLLQRHADLTRITAVILAAAATGLVISGPDVHLLAWAGIILAAVSLVLSLALWAALRGQEPGTGRRQG
jgi:phosphatidylglycerophosphate synthase